MRRSEKRKIRRKIKEKILQLLPFLVIIVFVTVAVKSVLKWDDLQRHHAFSNGTILKLDQDVRRAGLTITYIFSVAGKEFQSRHTYPKMFTSQLYLFEGKSFPIVFDTQDTTNNLMMITPANFKDYHIPYPDSLDWVIDCLVPPY